MGVCVNVGFHMNYINGYIIMRYVDFIRHLENELASPFLVNQVCGAFSISVTDKKIGIVGC
jgi:hypothetical protein